jgi:hypothetical protein
MDGDMRLHKGSRLQKKCAHFHPTPDIRQPETPPAI